MEQQQAPQRRAFSANTLKVANLLLVGHGGALLVIFNASANVGSALPTSVRTVAWCFAIGLVAAFLMVAAIFAFEEADLAPLKIGENAQTRQEKLAKHTVHGATCYLVSGLAFVFGLIAAIGFLPPSDPPPPASVSSAPSPSSEVEAASQARP